MTPTAQTCHDQSQATPEVNPLVMRWVLPNRLLNTVLPAEVLYVYPLIVENLGIGQEGEWRVSGIIFAWFTNAPWRSGGSAGLAPPTK